MADDFGMTPNNPAPAEGGEVATAPTPAGQGKGTSDQGQAQADAKNVTAEQLAKEFDIDPNAEGEKGEEKPAKTTVVDIKGEAEGEAEGEGEGEGEGKAEGEEEKTPEGAEGEVDEVTVEAFLKDTDDETRQELLTALADDDNLTLDFTRNGESVSQPVAEILRGAAGYPGAEAVTARAGDLKKAEEQLQADQKAFSATLENPSEFLDYMEGHLKDPIKFYTSMRDRAESVLKEAEDDEAGFLRKHAARREAVSDRQETVALREEVANLTKALSGKAPQISAVEEKAIVDEGVKRRSAVEAAGFDVNVIDNHWIAAGSPTDFARWFGAWSAINPDLKGEETSKPDNGKKPSSKTGGKKKGLPKTLRRQGSVGAGKPTATESTAPLGAEEIEDYLRKHPSNAHLK